MREDMKSMIADTFSQMLEKEDIDKITVTKLIGECHISGRPFIIISGYYGCTGLDVPPVNAGTRPSGPGGGRPGRGAYGICDFRQTEQDKAGKTALFPQVGPDRSHADRVCHDLSGGNGPGQGKDIRVSVDDMEVMLRFYASGMVGVLLQYVGKPHLDEEKLVIQMEKIITGKMFPGEQS